MSKYLTQWKVRSAPREIELSDGYRMLIRPVRLENLVMNGQIPLTLLRQMQAIRPRGDGSVPEEEALKMVDAIDAVVLAAVVDPPVTRAGGEDSVALADIPFADRVRIFQEVNAPATALQSFRGQPDGDADAAPRGEDVPPAAE